MSIYNIDHYNNDDDAGAAILEDFGRPVGFMTPLCEICVTAGRIQNDRTTLVGVEDTPGCSVTHSAQR